MWSAVIYWSADHLQLTNKLCAISADIVCPLPILYRVSVYSIHVNQVTYILILEMLDLCQFKSDDDQRVCGWLEWEKVWWNDDNG